MVSKATVKTKPRALLVTALPEKRSDVFEGRQTVRPAEVCKALGFCHSTFYKLKKEGRFHCVKVGSKTLVFVDSIREFLDNLPKA